MHGSSMYFDDILRLYDYFLVIQSTWLSLRKYENSNF